MPVSCRQDCKRFYHSAFQHFVRWLKNQEMYAMNLICKIVLSYRDNRQSGHSMRDHGNDVVKAFENYMASHDGKITHIYRFKFSVCRYFWQLNSILVIQNSPCFRVVRVLQAPHSVKLTHLHYTLNFCIPLRSTRKMRSKQ